MINKLISIVGMIAVYAMASGLERWLNRLERTAQETFEFVPLWWYRIGAYLVLSLLIVGLAWWVFHKSGRSKLVSFTIIGVGLLVFLGASPIMWGKWGDLPLTVFPRILVDMPFQGGFFFMVCTLIPAIGIFSLLPAPGEPDRS